MLSLLPFLLIIVVFWFFLIRPQTKRQREAQQMQAELTPGTKVMLTSGIFGTVREITEDYVLVEVSETSSIKVIRRAIGQTLPDDFGTPQAETADGDHELNAANDSVVVVPVESTESTERTDREDNR